MIDIVERLRATADFGIPDYTNSKILREASHEIVRLREETARLLAANKDLQLHFDVVIEDLKEAEEENARLRKALEPFAEMAQEFDDLFEGEEFWEDSALLDCPQFDRVPTVGDFRAARDIIREGGKDDVR